MNGRRQELWGWGRFPRCAADVFCPRSVGECQSLLQQPEALITRGLGRSYADSALATRVLDARHFDHMLDFQPATGLLRCEAGLSLAQILAWAVPRGWFLPVTPGTRFVTVGGAIASDVHGKNHHVVGTFGEHVQAIEILLGNGERTTASRQQHPELFAATCGGMGLTGVIIAAELRLRPIQSAWVQERTLKLANLDRLFEAFEEHQGATYSVAWIDCLQQGHALGRSLLMLGEHLSGTHLPAVERVRPWRLPIDMPDWALNSAVVASLNAVKWGLQRRQSSERICAYERFFYPLDALHDWNRLYGSGGFVQYQFVVPKASGLVAMRRVLELIAASGLGSFLAVLKAMGQQNAHHLSFPFEGYTLALDFKRVPALEPLLRRLDAVVLDYGGRIYLAKDSCMSEETFKASYPRWAEFEEVRARWHAHGRFASHQSRRLGLL